MKNLTLVSLVLASLACGRVNHVVDGGVETKSEVKVTVELDFSVCDDLYGEEKRQCILNLSELAKLAAQSAQNEGE